MISAPFRRAPFWEGRLAALVSARALVPFAWGTNDCVTFAADAVQAVTGRDPIADIRGTWSCERTAARAVGSFYGAYGDMHHVLDAMAQRSWWPRVPVGFARRGDLAIVPHEGRPTVAVVTGQAAMSPGPKGLVAVPMTAATRAWTI